MRGFLDGFCDLPETMEVRRAAAIVLDALNGWIHSQGQRDPDLAGMGCTFTALVLRGRIAHVLHVGDTRAYRLSRDRLTCLTTDHVRPTGAGRSSTLTRALGVETEVRLDYTSQPVAQHDRFLLCSDGVHGYLASETIADIMRERVSSEDTARALVAAALDAGSTDNSTALVLDVVGLETAESGRHRRQHRATAGDSGAARRRDHRWFCAQGLAVGRPLYAPVRSRGRSRGRRGGAEISQAAGRRSIAAYRAAFVREAWVGARVTSPWLGHVIELPPGRQTCLYTVMPLYQGELLETRLMRRPGARTGGRAQHCDQAGQGCGGAAPRRHRAPRHQA